MPDQEISRRTFLKVTTVAGMGMLVGCSFQTHPLVSTSDVKSEELGLFVRISKDNKITIISPTSEIGQGTHTAHAMIIAEELDAEWEKIKESYWQSVKAVYEKINIYYNERRSAMIENIERKQLLIDELKLITEKSDEIDSQKQ